MKPHSTSGMLVNYEPEIGHATDNPSTPKLVWRQLSRWAWESECGQFRIERFVIGEHEGIDDFPWPDRFRVHKRSPEWWGEVAPSEGSLASAQEAAEKLA